jgi:acetyltransferase
MTIRNLEHLFRPKSVALIGASERPGSLGGIVLRNLSTAGFTGQLMLVNPKHDRVQGRKCYSSVEALPGAPDLAVICTPPATVPELIDALGRRGNKAAIVLTAGLSSPSERGGPTLKAAMLDAAKPYLLRILGPNCVGLLVPSLKLNASFAHIDALPGKIAFVSQSGALVTAVLDWATSRGIGFSKLISLGDCADIDFGDVMDYLASDEQTHAILLYMESVTAARKFMSAARAAARSKPVLALKAGRAPEGAKAAMSHTGALAGSDDVYDAAIRRAGMLRVYSTEDLFGAVETLARARPLRGERLAIMTNGGGPAVMAVDALMAKQGSLARLSEETLRKLDAVLPATWSRGDPIDIIGDAPAERYVQALQVLLQDEQADSVLMIHAPTAVVPSAEIAEAVAPVARESTRNVIGCWVGGDALAKARSIFAHAGIPTCDTPEEAVQAFMQIVQYRRNQELLMEVPPSVPEEFVPDVGLARKVVGEASAAGRLLLSQPEVAAILQAYGIAFVETRFASCVDQAVAAAQELGFPVALKILSPDISHKSDVAGVALDLATSESVRIAAQAMHARARQLRPSAAIQGFTVQAMVRRPHARELIVGASEDRVFGPVILFGEGGTAVEVVADRAIGLPPLNMLLARELISRTRVARLLAGYRDRAPADSDAICRMLIQLAHLVIDIPEIVELDINPLLADDKGVLSLDARIRLAAPGNVKVDRCSIRPYPAELEERITWNGLATLIRPIKPEDGPQHVEFFNALDAEDVHYRMFMMMRELRASQLARFTQIDYDREMAFIATRELDGGRRQTLGVARVVADPDNVRAEFAIIVRSDLKGQGLGPILLKKLIDYLRSRGTAEVVGEALSNNTRLLRLVKRFGFEIEPVPGAGIVSLRLRLNPDAQGAQSRSVTNA